MPTQLNNADLARAFVAGRPGARDALLDRWLPQVLQWAARLGGPSTEVEDIAQDVFIVVIRRLEQVEDLERFPAWLYGVTRKTVAQHRRRAWRKRWVPGASTERASQRRDPSNEAEVSQLGRRVQAVLERLPALHREVLVLCDLEGRSATEAAALLSVPVGTVKSRLRLGRARFRKLATSYDLRSYLPAEGSA